MTHSVFKSDSPCMPYGLFPLQDKSFEFSLHEFASFGHMRMSIHYINYFNTQMALERKGLACSIISNKM